MSAARATGWSVMPASALTELDSAQRLHLLRQARASIAHGCANDQPLAPEIDTAPWLMKPAATFVTLTIATDLRGCIGSLQSRRSLLADVTANAFAAAFRDPRFAPVRADELLQLCIEIAVLSAPTPLPNFADDRALQSALRPGIDGVVIEQQGRRATFLPKVWVHAGDGTEFLFALRQKAGLPTRFDPAACYSTYQVLAFSERDGS